MMTAVMASHNLDPFPRARIFVQTGEAALALAEVSDGSVRSSRDVQAILGVPPLASIPVVETQSDRRRRLIRILAHASFAGLMISTAAAGVLYLS